MYDTVVSKEVVEKAQKSLKENGIESVVVSTRDEAKKQVLEMLPKGAEVMTMTSVTLDQTGIEQAINQSGDYEAVKPKLYALDRKTQGAEMQKMGASPTWAVGSVHAITEDGKVVIASNTGSQLPAYVYGSQHVIWVVGTQKIVSDLDSAMKRIYDYVLPLESKRAHEAYGMPHSNVSKLVIINKEIVPERITVVFVEEPLGF